MSTTYKWQRPLTKTEMEAIKADIEAATTGTDALIAAFVGFFDIVLRETENRTWAEFMADDDASLTPWDYALPQDQWGDIATAIGDRGRAIDPISQVNRMLDWMNKGPSSYERETAVK